MGASWGFILVVYAAGFLEGLCAFAGYLWLRRWLVEESPKPESRSTGPVIVPSTEPMVCGECGLEMEPDGRAGWKCPECGKSGLKLRVTRMTDEKEFEREKLELERRAAREPRGGRHE